MKYRERTTKLTFYGHWYYTQASYRNDHELSVEYIHLHVIEDRFEVMLNINTVRSNRRKK